MRNRSLENGLILGLVANCLVRPGVVDCPLQHLEDLSLDAQILKIEQLSDAEVDEIVMHHQQCMAAHADLN
jgi:hypothetical protein